MNRKLKIPLLLGGKKKAAGPWYLAGGVDAANCVAAYQAIGAASFAASKINLANPGTYDVTDGTKPPTWSAARGWIYSDADITTALLSAVPFANTYTIIVQFVGGGSDFGLDRTLMSVMPSGAYMLRGSGTNHGYKNGSTQLTVATALSGKHNMAMAGAAAYLDGVADGAIPTAALSVTGVVIGNNAAQSRGVIADITAVSVYNTALTAPQVAAISTAMAALP